jgi:hypothetical protein
MSLLLSLNWHQARQANVLLRDKLTDFSSQLAEARDRIYDLEHALQAKEAANKLALDNLHSASTAISLTHPYCWLMTLEIPSRQTKRRRCKN